MGDIVKYDGNRKNLTTESADGKIEEGRQAGASGWMVKPFSPEELVKIVNKFVR